MVGAFEDFDRRTASPGSGNLLIFEIRFATNPHLVPGWGGWGITLTPALANVKAAFIEILKRPSSLSGLLYYTLTLSNKRAQ